VVCLLTLVNQDFHLHDIYSYNISQSHDQLQNESFIPPPNLDSTLPIPSNNANHDHIRQRQQNSQTFYSTLNQLKADEELLRRRKENIARFGSTWLKPPGVSKTLQAETEEKLEKEEQEALMRREQLMLDMQAQQEAEERRVRAEAEENEHHGEGLEEEERDLDDEMADGMDVDLDDEFEDQDELGDDEEEEEEEDDGELSEQAINLGLTTGDVTFNDGSLIEGSMLGGHGEVSITDSENMERELREQERFARLEEAELTGIVQDEYELGMNVDLDNSIPEAGSYEHTDTEIEDDSSDEEEGSQLQHSFSAALSGDSLRQAQNIQRPNIFDGSRTRQVGGRTSLASRASLSGQDISSLLESSFTSSSPAIGRSRTNTRHNHNHV